MERISLSHVENIPQNLETGILYVSMQYEIAAHLCACGCDNEVFTPLGTTDWKFTEKKGEPTLSPSIGSWQLPCKSDYFIRNGRIEWSYQWSEERIARGRHAEERKQILYYQKTKISAKSDSVIKRFLKWLYS